MPEKVLRNFDRNHQSKGGVATLMILLRQGSALKHIASHYDLSEVMMRGIIKELLGINFANWESKYLSKNKSHLDQAANTHPIKGESLCDDGKEEVATNRENENEFTEIHRVKIGSQTHLILSRVGGGYLINKQYKLYGVDRYTKGIYATKEIMIRIKEWIEKPIHKSIEIELSKDEKILIRHTIDGKIDIRHFINTPLYVGFTKKGVREHRDTLLKLLKSFVE